jgi:DNA-binding GntR family transcriptional regulator
MTGTRQHAGTAVQRITTALREEILSGRIPLDAPLREEQLAARFSASRHTVRTALATLAGTGLVRTEPFHGTRVARFDASKAAELQDLRRALESEAVDILYRRYEGGQWPADVRAPIEAAIERLASAESVGDDVEVLRAHAAVHTALVAAAGSPRITLAHESLTDEITLLLLHTRPQYATGELGPQHRTLLNETQRLGAEPIRAHLADTVDRLALGGRNHEGGGNDDPRPRFLSVVL